VDGHNSIETLRNPHYKGCKHGKWRNGQKNCIGQSESQRFITPERAFGLSTLPKAGLLSQSRRLSLIIWRRRSRAVRTKLRAFVSENKVQLTAGGVSGLWGFSYAYVHSAKTSSTAVYSSMQSGRKGWREGRCSNSSIRAQEPKRLSGSK